MFKERPLRWIGEAEARRMMIHAISETPAPPPQALNDNEEQASWLERMRRRVFGRSEEVGC